MGDTRRVEHLVLMGLGEAVLRLVHVELRYAQGLFDVPDALKEERKLIVQALNHYQLDLGFDCDGDGAVDVVTVATDVNIFKQSAETSCCRILPKDTSRKGKAPKAAVPPVHVSPSPPKAEPPVRIDPLPVDLPLGGEIEVPTPRLASPVEAPTPVPPPLVLPTPEVIPCVPKAARGDLSRRKR